MGSGNHCPTLRRFACQSRIHAGLIDTVRKNSMPARSNANQSAVTIKPGPRLRTAMILAIVADVLQLAVIPLFIEGAGSPADDILDLCVGGALTWLLGWHWEFAPSFLGKLIPGVDLVPLWTLAVANVYRKAKPLAAASAAQHAAGTDTRSS